MMQVHNFNDSILICDLIDSGLIDKVNNYEFINVFKGLVLYKITNGTKDIETYNSITLRKYFDRIYLATHPEDKNRNDKIYKDYFAFISIYYENYVDKNRNLQNIENLLFAAKNHLGDTTNKYIMDFGCGVGFSVDISSKYGSNIVGYDSCYEMLMLAKKRGMETWSDEKLNTSETNIFDAIISSYVFHLISNYDTVIRAWSLLKPNGILVANFHKFLGISDALNIFNRVGAEIKFLETSDNDHQHGKYIGFIKRK